VPRRAEAVTLNDCLQLSYLPSKRSHMLLLYPREILILDLELSQTVGVVAIERSGVPFLQVSRLLSGALSVVTDGGSWALAGPLCDGEASPLCSSALSIGSSGRPCMTLGMCDLQSLGAVSCSYQQTGDVLRVRGTLSRCSSSALP